MDRHMDDQHDTIITCHYVAGYKNEKLELMYLSLLTMISMIHVTCKNWQTA